MENDSTCPLCGADNHCAMARGQGHTDCWCKAVKISAGQLQAVPPEARNQRCICPACAAREETRL